MTNASETMSPKPFGGEHYSAASDTAVAHKAVMVLDLSCKRQRQCSPPANHSNDSPVSSPYREGTSDYLENKHEANNNDRGHVNNYNHQASKEQQQQIRPIHPVPSSNYHQAYQECQERKSPESRSSMLTPPSDIESPKKVKLESSQANHMTADEMQLHASFQHFLASDSLPVKLPMSVPSAQSAASSVQTSIAGGGFAPSVPGLPYMPAAMLPNILGMSPSSSGLVPDIPTSTSPTASQISAGSQDESKKVPRPFKAYPKDPLSISITSDMMFDPEVKQSYYDFRNRMLDSVKKTNEGTNIKMRRVSKSPTLPTSTLDDKDAAYWERRRKNNEAAKRSRDARRAKEDEIAIKAAFLEQEYLRLKCENSLLKEEITRMKYLSYRH